jgi:hypothetical protein
MNELLDELERGLTDLLQMGLATAGADMVRRLRELSDRAECAGLHTGGALFSQIATLLEERAHTMAKTDLEIANAVFRAQHYITLCRSRMTEEDIRARWQEGGTA